MTFHSDNPSFSKNHKTPFKGKQYYQPNPKGSMRSPWLIECARVEIGSCIYTPKQSSAVAAINWARRNGRRFRQKIIADRQIKLTRVE